MGGHSHYSEGYGPVGPAPAEHNVVYTTLHFDKPWSYENYLKTGGYSALRKILEEKIEPAAVIEMVKACARCVITTTDQETGERGREPLRTLASYRTIDRGIRFGQNAVPRELGTLTVGDEVEVLETAR